MDGRAFLRRKCRTRDPGFTSIHQPHAHTHIVICYASFSFSPQALDDARQVERESGRQSEEMSRMAEESRRLAEQQEQEAENIKNTADEALKTSRDAMQLAREAFAKQEVSDQFYMRLRISIRGCVRP